MRDYHRIWTGNALVNLADGLAFVAVPLLATTVTDDPVKIAALAMSYSLPRLLSVLGVGVTVDMFDRRRILYWANIARALLFAGLTLLSLSGSTTILALFVVNATLGVVETMADNAAVAIVQQAVPTKRLDRANSQIAGTQIVMDEFIGPPLGGITFAFSAVAPTALISLAFFGAGLAFATIRGNYKPPPSTPDASDVRVAKHVVEGLRWSWHHGAARILVLVGFLASIGYMIPFSYLVLYAQSTLGLNPFGYGLLLSVSALGGLLGSILAAPLRRRFGYANTIIGALLLGAAAFVTISMSDHPVLVGVALALYIAHAVVWNILASSVRQKITPPSLMGRVLSVSRLFSISGLIIGAGLGGVLARQLGYQQPFAIAGGLFLLAALSMLVTRRHFREIT